MLTAPDREQVAGMIDTAVSPVEAKADSALGMLSGASASYLIPVGVDAKGRSVDLSVQDVGTPTNGTLVIIPGTNFDAEAYQYQTTFFVNAGFRVVTIDQRGQGNSSKPAYVAQDPLVAPPPDAEYSLDVFADDLKVVLDKIQPAIQGATMLGHSLGTAIAVHYAVKYKNAHISKLALTGMISTVVPNPDLGATPTDYANFIGLGTLDYGLLASTVMAEIFAGGDQPLGPPGPPGASAGTIQQYQDILLTTPQYIDIKLGPLERFGFGVVATDLPQVSVPTKFLVGTGDIATPPANATAAQALIPRHFRQGLQTSLPGTWSSIR